jgi:hypothetical protein
MSRPRSRARSQPQHRFPAVDATHLEALASVLLEGAPLAFGDPPQLVRLRGGTDDLGTGELELGLLPLDDVHHPYEGLAGFHAPDDWIAIGLLATGRATRTDRPGPRGAFPVATAHLVARRGAWASAWRPFRPGDGSAGSSAGGGDSDTSMPTGRLDDALRLALDLPTPPPPGTTHELWAAEWLDAVLVRAGATRGRRAPLDRCSVLRLHPAVAALDLDGSAITVAELIAEADRLAAWRDWTQLRRACAEGRWSHPLVDPALAEWLDDGAFARLVLSTWPDLVDLHDAVLAVLPADAGTAVDVALDTWGVGPEGP